MLGSNKEFITTAQLMAQVLAQRTNVQSQVWYHSAIQALQAIQALSRSLFALLESAFFSFSLYVRKRNKILIYFSFLLGQAMEAEKKKIGSECKKKEASSHITFWWPMLVRFIHSCWPFRFSFSLSLSLFLFLFLFLSLFLIPALHTPKQTNKKCTTLGD